MLNKIKRLLKGTLREKAFIASDWITEEIIRDKNFPFLVSFPRTGSHWLRMMMELYFEVPSLRLIFFEKFKNAVAFTCCHRHDEDLQLKRKNVLYLYRNPVPTVFSQIKFYNEPINDENRIVHWANLYAQHLKKWLFEETFTQTKTILTYEELQKDLAHAFKKVCEYFGKPFEKKRILAISNAVSKERIKSRTQHDHRVINLSADYNEWRETFKTQYTDLVMATVLKEDKRFKQLF